MPVCCSRSIPIACGLLATAGGSAPGAVFAQCAPEFVRQLDPFSFCDGSGIVSHAWYGGWRNPRPQLLDVDADGDLDLFVAEEEGQLRFFRNVGDAQAWSWVQETDDYAGLHERFYARFVDIDADGDFDLLVEGPPFDTGSTVIATALLYTNVGTPAAPDYQNLSPHPQGLLVDENGAPIEIRLTAPDFVDLDLDGDPDLMFGVSQQTGPVVLWRNVGTRQVASFRFETSSYGDVDIVRTACIPSAPRSGPGHGFMLFSFFDVDVDGKPEMFVGDSNSSNVYFWDIAGGTLQNPDYDCVTADYFQAPGGGPAFFDLMAFPAFGDLDDDGDMDAVVGSGMSNRLGLAYYRNDGSSPSVPVHVLVDSTWIPEFDLGGDTQPAFADLDGDSDPDLFLGAATQQTVSYWENLGSGPCQFAVTDPGWRFVQNADWLAAEFADLDADGDLDSFIGGSKGEILWFRNDGDVADASGFVEVIDTDFGDVASNTFRSLIDSQSTPRFFDEDGDGDLDLLIGFRKFSTPLTAPLLFFRNDGTPQAHAFVLASSDYQSLGPFGQGAAPAIGDLDGDGDSDLVVGRLDGTIAFVRNVGEVGAPVFVREDEMLGGIDVGVRSVPSLADLDGDGDLDLVVGESGGGLNYYRNDTPPAPTAFALGEPASDAVLDGRIPTTFRWGKSFDPSTGLEVEYELRIAPSAIAPVSQWIVVPAAVNQATVRLYSTPARTWADVWWTVAATCGLSPGWRHVVHANPDTLHQDPPGEYEYPADLAIALAITNVFPSPAVDVTKIEFTLPDGGRTRVSVHDLAGRTVAILADETLDAGRHRREWKGVNTRGAAVAPGVYLVRVALGDRAVSRRLVRLR